MGTATLILAGQTIDITTEGIILVFVVLVLLGIGAIVYLWSIMSIAWNSMGGRKQSRFALAAFGIGTCCVVTYLALLALSTGPAEPELEQALADVVAESVIDQSAFNEHGISRTT